MRPDIFQNMGGKHSSSEPSQCYSSIPPGFMKALLVPSAGHYCIAGPQGSRDRKAVAVCSQLCWGNWAQLLEKDPAGVCRELESRKLPLSLPSKLRGAHSLSTLLCCLPEFPDLFCFAVCIKPHSIPTLAEGIN